MNVRYFVAGLKAHTKYLIYNITFLWCFWFQFFICYIFQNIFFKQFSFTACGNYFTRLQMVLFQQCANCRSKIPTQENKKQCSAMK